MAANDVLKLDLDAYTSENYDLKAQLTHAATKTPDRQKLQAEVASLKDEVRKYKQLYEANRSTEAITKYRIKKAVEGAEEKMMAEEERLLSALSIRDETIKDLSRAKVGLKAKVEELEGKRGVGKKVR